MAFQFSEKDRQIIREHPISDILKPFREFLLKDVGNKDIGNFDEYITRAATEREPAKLFQKLIMELVEVEAAEALFLPVESSFALLLSEFISVWMKQDQFPDTLRLYCSSLLERVAS